MLPLCALSLPTLLTSAPYCSLTCGCCGYCHAGAERKPVLSMEKLREPSLREVLAEIRWAGGWQGEAAADERLLLLPLALLLLLPVLLLRCCCRCCCSGHPPFVAASTAAAHHWGSPRGAPHVQVGAWGPADGAAVSFLPPSFRAQLLCLSFFLSFLQVWACDPLPGHLQLAVGSGGGQPGRDARRGVQGRAEGGAGPGRAGGVGRGGGWGGVGGGWGLREAQVLGTQVGWGWVGGGWGVGWGGVGWGVGAEGCLSCAPQEPQQAY